MAHLTTSRDILVREGPEAQTDQDVAVVAEEDHEYNTAGLPIWAPIVRPGSAHPASIPVAEPERSPVRSSQEPPRIEPHYILESYRRRRWRRILGPLDPGGVAIGCFEGRKEAKSTVAPLVRFVPHADGVRIFDLGGGAFHPVLEPLVLADGDRFRVGGQTFTFHAGKLSSVADSQSLPPRLELVRREAAKGPRFPMLDAVIFIGRDPAHARSHSWMITGLAGFMLGFWSRGNESSFRT